DLLARTDAAYLIERECQRALEAGGWYGTPHRQEVWYPRTPVDVEASYGQVAGEIWAARRMTTDPPQDLLSMVSYFGWNSEEIWAMFPGNVQAYLSSRSRAMAGGSEIALESRGAFGFYTVTWYDLATRRWRRLNDL